MKIIVFSNHIGVLPVLEYLSKCGWLQGLIFTDKLQGHNLQIENFCSQSSVSFYQVNRQQLHKETAMLLHELKPDMAIMFGFSYRIPQEVFSIPAMGFYNVHFSLLPAYKGPDPIFWQLRNGEKTGGISIHKVTEEFDSGTVVVQEQIPFIPGENWGICNNRYTPVVQKVLRQFIQDLYNRKKLPELQIQQSSSYYQRPGTEDLTINWDLMSAAEIENLVNAANPCYGGAMTFLDGQLIRILEVTPATLASAGDYKAGMIVYSQPDSGIFVACRNNEYLRINVLQTVDGIFSGFKLAALGIQAGQSFEQIKKSTQLFSI